MHDNSNGRGAWAMRASFPLIAAALAACSDDTPTQPKANLPATGPAKPSAVIHIIPEGTTFPTKIAFATGNPAGKEAMVKLYDKDGNQITSFLAFGSYADFSAGVIGGQPLTVTGEFHISDCAGNRQPRDDLHRGEVLNGNMPICTHLAGREPALLRKKGRDADRRPAKHSTVRQAIRGEVE